LYSKSFLYIYDWMALGLFSSLVWRCPSRYLLKFYNENVTANHLDIGVGTGYFLDNCQFPSSAPRLVLMDLNPNSLEVAERRLARYNPVVYRRNALEPFDIGAAGFDSISLMNLLHCLPGDMGSKEVVFEHAGAVLNRGGVLFGSTILGRGEKCGGLAGLVLRVTNRAGFMTNLKDDIGALKEALNRHFSESSVRVTGCQALFRAKK
ncbi:MAG: class I SAM-dependent methyltransferase, partial [Dehalococcoidales bacterium]